MESNWVCGIDMGSLNTVSYVAWLKSKEFLLDLYRPTHNNPLPQPGFTRFVACYAIDAPQGLPLKGNRRRLCDEEAKTPTSVLPADLKALADWKLYGGLVRCGVAVFWSIYNSGQARIFGFDGPSNVPIVAETYPRKTAIQLGLPRLPSKRNDTLAYVDCIWALLKSLGYSCDSVVRPCVDHIDAMLCAIAAEAVINASDTVVKLGRKPEVDEEEPILREGLIVCP